MNTGRAIPVVQVGGSHWEMGCQVGEASASTIRRMVEAYKARLSAARHGQGLTWEGALLQASKYYPYAVEHTPQYVDELRGMAEGAEVAFDDLMVLNCWEEITDDAIYQRCTSTAVSAELAADGHVLVGHNEDWLPEDEENVYLVNATPDDEPPFLAMTYGGLLPNIGFNAQGIAQCCDSVYPDDVHVGVPRIFVSRAVLGAVRLGEAIRRTLLPARAAGYNHLIADRSGELYNVEVSARRSAILYGARGYLAHTNNYHSRRMKQLEDKTEDLVSSRLRVNRATRLLRSTGPHSLETLKAILSDHANYPDSICRHPNPEDESPDQGKTIAALIMDLTGLEMHACWGNPCAATFRTYRLES